ncbi:hypothetical protein D5b_00490 [Faustovirus]|nr:hypothetical protein D5b_00490 [Faustovirus]AMN84430.1 hypothetical protein D6_00018 [Faustovirus]AMP44428.1 hypothetical protein PRJ_Dakar_00478 [Faustovirus]
MDKLTEILATAAFQLDAGVADQVIAMLNDWARREQFDVLAEALDMTLNGAAIIDWTTPSGMRIREWIATWIATICTDMYSDATNNADRAALLRASYGCISTRTYAVKEVCLMYREYKSREWELLLDACDLK